MRKISFLMSFEIGKAIWNAELLRKSLGEWIIDNNTLCFLYFIVIDIANNGNFTKVLCFTFHHSWIRRHRKLNKIQILLLKSILQAAHLADLACKDTPEISFFIIPFISGLQKHQLLLYNVPSISA